MVPQTSPPAPGRTLAIISLLVALIALLLVIFDGACRPDPVPAAQPYVPQEMPVAPATTAQLPAPAPAPAVNAPAEVVP